MPTCSVDEMAQGSGGSEVSPGSCGDLFISTKGGTPCETDLRAAATQPGSADILERLDMSNREFHKGISVVSGWSVSPLPPENSLGLSQQSSAAELVGVGNGASTFEWYERVDALEEHSGALSTQRDQDDGGATSGACRSSTRAKQQAAVNPKARVTVAATAVARQKREAVDSRRRVLAPLVLQRQDSEAHIVRLPFNFDSAQAPSSGMSGVGIAVPRGFSDSRFADSSRRFGGVSPDGYSAQTFYLLVCGIKDFHTGSSGRNASIADGHLSS